MNPPEPQPARRRGRKNRAFHDLLAGLAAAACVLAFMLFSSRVGTAAASGGTTPPPLPQAPTAPLKANSQVWTWKRPPPKPARMRPLCRRSFPGTFAW